MLQPAELQRLLLHSTGWQRFTQDSPIFADVWMGFLNPATGLARTEADGRQDLLLESHHQAPTGHLASSLRARLPEVVAAHELAYAGEYVAIRLTLEELLTAALPLSAWWRGLVRPEPGSVFAHLREFVSGERLAPDAGRATMEVPPPSDELEWLLTVAGRLLTDTSDDEAEAEGLDGRLPTGTSDAEATAIGLRRKRTLTRRVLERLGQPTDEELPRVPPLWSVSRNRPVRRTLWRSRQTVKADAASRVFPADTEGLAWAVVDSGIDATHTAFRRRDAQGRPQPLDRSNAFYDSTTVRATYDFTRLRRQIAQAILSGPDRPGGPAQLTAELREALAHGRAVDWRLYQPLVQIRHDGTYEPPKDAHGTHVAGTLAGDWRDDDPQPRPRHPLRGVCPGLTLFDLRVLDEHGEGDEFSVLAALSFVRWRNAESGGTVVHGVNLSFALDHDVLNSACGRSPVCLEAERVHNAGVVVVAAAGNEGRADYSYRGEVREGYRTVSISDPGNAETAITVGSTHRLEPHAYGVSYFSSRGPTGDGRAKPDLVAPGEKITAPVPGDESARMDGTSMAAPHVSGAAALLMSRHRELVGRPTMVKRVLCESATDLGRERHYQGHGMVDILRALQAL